MKNCFIYSQRTLFGNEPTGCITFGEAFRPYKSIRGAPGGSGV